MPTSETIKTDEGADLLFSPEEPGYKKPRKPQVFIDESAKLSKVKKPRSKGVVKIYFSYLVEVVLS